MKKITRYLSILATAIIGVGSVSCSMFGLDLQEDYDYTHTPVEPLDVTAYEFIESRKNIDMSMLYEAINRVDYRSVFEAEGFTYIVYPDLAFGRFLEGKKMLSVSSMNDEQIRTTLNTLVVQGFYSSLELTEAPLEVETLNPNQNMLLYLKKDASDNPYKVYVMLTGTTAERDVKTSNIVTTNGVMHTIDYALNMAW